MIKDDVFKSESEMPEMPVTIGDMTINKTADWRNITPVINYEKCSRCMICWKFCPDVAIQIQKETFPSQEEDPLLKGCVPLPLMSPVINYEYCKGCGICAVECPQNAIEMVVDDK